MTYTLKDLKALHTAVAKGCKEADDCARLYGPASVEFGATNRAYTRILEQFAHATATWLEAQGL